MPFQINLKIKGLNKMLKKFSPERARELKHQIALAQLDEVQQAIVEARNRVPVRTGHLRDSIGLIMWNPDEMRIIAGTPCYYAHFVEFGTVKMRARPFWCPAIWEAFFRFRERAQKIIDEFSEGE